MSILILHKTKISTRHIKCSTHICLNNIWIKICFKLLSCKYLFVCWKQLHYNKYAGQIPCDQFNCLLTVDYSMITYLHWNIWKLVKVWRIINGPDHDGDHSWSLPDVAPVHVPEPVQPHDLILALDTVLSVVTKSSGGIRVLRISKLLKN